MATNAFELRPMEVAEIFNLVTGAGGHQTLTRTLQAKIDRQAGSIELTDAEVGRIFRYSGYGQGGFQGR